MLKRIGLLIGCVLLLLAAWTAVLSMKSPLEKQTELIVLADAELGLGLPANAEPFLLDAAKYNTKHTQGVLERLKQVYSSLGSTMEYASALKEQTARADCPVEAYIEYANYLVGDRKLEDALAIYRLGIGRTGDATLWNYYEDIRYAFKIESDYYEDVTAYHSGGIQVKTDGLWGLANAAGNILIPCEYEQISTYDGANKGCVIVRLADAGLNAVNLKNHVVAKTDLKAAQIGNLSQDIIPLRLANGKWIIANSKLVSSDTEFEGLGTCANSAMAMKSGGKWGVVTTDSKSILPFEYDEIIMDEIGRCYAQKAVFAKKGAAVYLYVDGKQLGDTYEDARPFTDDGWAAVRKGGKWGFIDTAGQLMIEPKFDDALSFSGHLAAVKQGGLWGYVSLSGWVVIEPQFLVAKSFLQGYAPVLVAERDGGYMMASTPEAYFFLSLVENDYSLMTRSASAPPKASPAAAASSAASEMSRADSGASSQAPSATPDATSSSASSASPSESSAAASTSSTAASAPSATTPSAADVSDIIGRWSLFPGHDMDEYGGVEFKPDGTFVFIMVDISVQATISESASKSETTMGDKYTETGSYAVKDDTIICTNVRDVSDNSKVDDYIWQYAVTSSKGEGVDSMYPNTTWLEVTPLDDAAMAITMSFSRPDK